MSHNSGAVERVRVRTPGKYIVLSVLAALSVVAVSVTIADRAPLFTTQSQTALETVKVGKTHYVPLPEFLIDLSPDRSGRITYLKMSTSIVVKRGQEQQTLERIAAVQPYIIERTTFFLRELQPEDFHGSEGMARVKGELLRRVNLVLGPVKADDVVINDLVIQ